MEIEIALIKIKKLNKYKTINIIERGLYGSFIHFYDVSFLLFAIYNLNDETLIIV